MGWTESLSVVTGAVIAIAARLCGEADQMAFFWAIESEADVL
jgi:hypothetical protein